MWMWHGKFCTWLYLWFAEILTPYIISWQLNCNGSCVTNGKWSGFELVSPALFFQLPHSWIITTWRGCECLLDGFEKLVKWLDTPPPTPPTQPNLGSERCGRRADKHSNTGSLCSPEGPSYHHFLLPVVLSLVLSTEYAVHVHHSYDNPCHVTRRLSCGSLDEFFNSVTGIGALFDSFLPWMYLLLENDCTMWIVCQKESITHATCYLKYNNLV